MLPSIRDAYRRMPQRSEPGPCVLPFPLLLVSEPGPAWIMPGAGTFTHRQHAARPECIVPPRIARPKTGGESGRICAAFSRTARTRMPSVSSLRRDRIGRSGSVRPSGRALPTEPAKLSPPAETVLCRHVLPAQVPALKNPAFDLTTRLAFAALASAVPERTPIHPNARKTGETVEPLRSAVRSQTAIALAKRPGHKLGRSGRSAARRLLLHALFRAHALQLLEKTSQFRSTTRCSATRSRRINGDSVASLPGARIANRQSPLRFGHQMGSAVVPLISSITKLAEMPAIGIFAMRRW